MISKIAVKLFLDNFNYLDKSGQRNGFLIFNNAELTKDNVANAAMLRASLAALDAEDTKTDSVKCNEFVGLLQSAFKRVEQSRIDFSKCTRRGAGNNAIVYKKPYKPAMFEKQLLAGLDTVIAQLSEVIKWPGNEGDAEQLKVARELKTACCELFYDISHFKPDAEVMIFSDTPGLAS